MGTDPKVRSCSAAGNNRKRGVGEVGLGVIEVVAVEAVKGGWIDAMMGIFGSD